MYYAKLDPTEVDTVNRSDRTPNIPKQIFPDYIGSKTLFILSMNDNPKIKIGKSRSNII